MTPMDPKEEVKARLDIVDFIGEYLPLKAAGSNHKGLCPFHTEKSPSFMVSRDRGSWHCFGCNEGGDIFSFVMKMEGLDFPEALRLLATKAGVQLPRYNPEAASQRSRLLDVVSAAAELWRGLLQRDPRADGVRAYLKTRQVSDETAEEFGLGYAPDSWEETGAHLRKRGFTDADVFAAGFTIRRERGVGFYDRFRHRLMFPIHDAHGEIVGFGGRVLEGGVNVGAAVEGGGAKYINTPQTPVYNKGSLVYNLHRAKPAIKTAGVAILVEGYMDAIASWQAGVRHVVATSGTALTPDQLKLLRRYTTTLLLAFDADPAGQTAATRGIDLALSADFNLRVIRVPQGKDPDECIRANPADWSAAVERAQPIMEYYLGQVSAQHDLTSAVGKKAAARTLLPVIAKIADGVERAHWLRQLADLLQVPEAVLREALPRAPASSAVRPASPAPSSPPQAGVDSRRVMLEDTILALALKYPQHLPTLVERLDPSYLVAPARQALYRALIVWYTQQRSGSTVSARDLQAFSLALAQSPHPDSAALANDIPTLILLAERDFFAFEPTAIRGELLGAVQQLKRQHLHAEVNRVQQHLHAAEARGDAAAVQESSQQLNHLLTLVKLLG